MEKTHRLNLIKNSPRPSYKPPQPVFQRTKTLKKHNYFESNLSLLSSNGSILEQSSYYSSQEDIQQELASFIKQNQQIKDKKPQHKWQQMTVEVKHDMNRTLTVINIKSQHPEDYFDGLFSDSQDSIKGSQKYVYKGDKNRSDSGTQSIKSSETEIVESNTVKPKKWPLREKGQQLHESSSNSSDLVNLLMKRKTHQETQGVEKRYERKAKKSISYNQSDETRQMWQFILEQQKFRMQNIKKPRKCSEDLSRKSRNVSPSFEENKFDKKKNNFLLIESPEKNSSKPNNRKTFVVSNRKNKDSSNSISNIFGKNQRDSEYKVKRLKKEKQQETTCSICLCDIEDRSKLPCKHSFCRPCLIDWIDKTSNCPNCRKNAEFYTYKGEQFKIEQKAYSLENYVDNIGDSDDEEDFMLDCECYNCDQTQEGDELLVCDRCLVNASHVHCDPALKGREPPAHREWFCHVCRARPNMWYREMRDD